MSVPGAGVDELRVGVDERAALQAFLDRQRELVAWKLADCDADTLQRASSPSGMTPLGVGQHLCDVERFWWREQVLGEDAPGFPWSGGDPGGSWRLVPGATTASVLATYAEECRVCDALVADLPLDQVGRQTPYTVRWVYLHVIEETARHLGQLDLLREQADGVTGEDPSS